MVENELVQVTRELLKILEHNNYTHGLHKVREEPNWLNFQVKAQAQLERSTEVKQILLNLPNDAGVCYIIYTN